MRIISLVAAAGESRRMQTCKALLRISHTTFVEHLVQVFLSVSQDVYVSVSLQNSAAIERAITHTQAHTVQNQWPHRALLGSVQSVLQKEPLADALILCPVDMPFVSADLLQRLTSHFRKSPKPSICVASHQGHRGHPLLVSQGFFSKILKLDDSHSMHDFLAWHHEDVIEVETHDARVLLNINTQADYQLHLAPSAKPS